MSSKDEELFESVMIAQLDGNPEQRSIKLYQLAGECADITRLNDLTNQFKSMEGATAGEQGATIIEMATEIQSQCAKIIAHREQPRKDMLGLEELGKLMKYTWDNTLGDQKKIEALLNENDFHVNRLSGSVVARCGRNPEIISMVVDKYLLQSPDDLTPKMISTAMQIQKLCYSKADESTMEAKETRGKVEEKPRSRIVEKLQSKLSIFARKPPKVKSQEKDEGPKPPKPN